MPRLTVPRRFYQRRNRATEGIDYSTESIPQFSLGVATSHVKGRALVALEFIPAKEYVAEFCIPSLLRVMRKEDIDRLPEAHEAFWNDYAADVGDRKGKRQLCAAPAIYEVKGPYTHRFRPRMRGNTASPVYRGYLANHSTSPNCSLVWWVDRRRRYRLSLMSLRPIPADTQITIDYKYRLDQK